MTQLVSPDNFARAESDLYFAGIVKDDGFGGFFHNRELTPMNHQMVIRQNRGRSQRAGHTAKSTKTSYFRWRSDDFVDFAVCTEPV